jgi:hypothetical protein
MRNLFFAALLVVAAGARADQKNVQILKGMSDLQLQRTMNMMRASLGVRCDYCHVNDEKTGWDFASDAKDEKRQARDMIRMTIQMNHDYFKERPEISCVTCHRGSSAHPAGSVTLPQTAPPPPTPKSARPEMPPLADVVKKYAAAIGDASRFALPRTLKGTREMSDGKPVPIVIEQHGAQFHATVETEEGKSEQAINDDGGWSRGPKGVVAPLKESQVENQREILAAFEPLLPSAIPANARVVAKDRIGERDVIVVSSRISETQRQRLSFDAASGLLLRRVVLTATPIGEIPRQTDYDDWRDVGGTKFPFSVRVSLVDPWVGSWRRYTDVKLGAAVSEAAFKQPQS